MEACVPIRLRGLRLDPYAPFAEAALRKRGERLPKKPRISVANIEDLLLSAGKRPATKRRSHPSGRYSILPLRCRPGHSSTDTSDIRDPAAQSGAKAWGLKRRRYRTKL
jgi:hypothetical protein